jgi:peptidoglycan/LPS O-acetylase OafA/YrhL
MARNATICHSPPMQRRRSTAAGGIFIFLGLLAGAVYGIDRGDPMLWMLRGFGAGIVLAILVWLIDRWRD